MREQKQIFSGDRFFFGKYLRPLRMQNFHTYIKEFQTIDWLLSK